MNPYVKEVKTLSDYQLELTFENGEIRIFDLKPYLNRGVFARLTDIGKFNSAHVVSGSVEWLGEVDLSYDTLYLDSRPAETANMGGQATRSRN